MYVITSFMTMLMAIDYELTAWCISIVAQHSNGTIYHG